MKRKEEIVRGNGKDLRKQRDKMFKKLREINDYIKQLTDVARVKPTPEQRLIEDDTTQSFLAGSETLERTPTVGEVDSTTQSEDDKPTADLESMKRVKSKEKTSNLKEGNQVEDKVEKADDNVKLQKMDNWVQVKKEKQQIKEKHIDEKQQMQGMQKEEKENMKETQTEDKQQNKEQKHEGKILGGKQSKTIEEGRSEKAGNSEEEKGGNNVGKLGSAGKEKGESHVEKNGIVDKDNSEPGGETVLAIVENVNPQKPTGANMELKGTASAMNDETIASEAKTPVTTLGESKDTTQGTTGEGVVSVGDQSNQMVTVSDQSNQNVLNNGEGATTTLTEENPKASVTDHSDQSNHIANQQGKADQTVKTHSHQRNHKANPPDQTIQNHSHQSNHAANQAEQVDQEAQDHVPESNHVETDNHQNRQFNDQINQSNQISNHLHQTDQLGNQLNHADQVDNIHQVSQVDAHLHHVSQVSDQSNHVDNHLHQSDHIGHHNSLIGDQSHEVVNHLPNVDHMDDHGHQSNQIVDHLHQSDQNANLMVEHQYQKVSQLGNQIESVKSSTKYHFHPQLDEDEDDMQLTNYAKQEIGHHGNLSESVIRNLVRIIKKKLIEGGFTKHTNLTASSNQDQNSKMTNKKDDKVHDIDGNNSLKDSGESGLYFNDGFTRGLKEGQGSGRLHLYDQIVSNLLKVLKENVVADGESRKLGPSSSTPSKANDLESASNKDIIVQSSTGENNPTKNLNDEEGQQRQRMLKSLYSLSKEIENFKGFLKEKESKERKVTEKGKLGKMKLAPDEADVTANAARITPSFEAMSSAEGTKKDNTEKVEGNENGSMFNAKQNKLSNQNVMNTESQDLQHQAEAFVKERTFLAKNDSTAMNGGLPAIINGGLMNNEILDSTQYNMALGLGGNEDVMANTRSSAVLATSKEPNNDNSNTTLAFKQSAQETASAAETAQNIDNDVKSNNKNTNENEGVSKLAGDKPVVVDGYAGLVSKLGDKHRMYDPPVQTENKEIKPQPQATEPETKNADKRTSYTDTLAKTVEQLLGDVTVPGLLSAQMQGDGTPFNLPNYYKGYDEAVRGALRYVVRSKYFLHLV